MSSHDETSQVKVIVVGASTGGVDALNLLFSSLKKNFTIPMVVVLHVSPHSSLIIDAFQPPVGVTLKEAEDKETLSDHHIYFAPPNYHLLLERDKSFSLSVEEPVNYSRPSLDVTFLSAAEAFETAALGIILTGANEDGAQGMCAIKRLGGITLVQDPQSAQNSYMPQSALALIRPTFIGTIEGIANFLSQLADLKPSDPGKAMSHVE